MNLKTGNINIENSTCEKLLGVKVDKKLNFDKHLDGIIKNVSCYDFPFHGLNEKTLFNELILHFTIQLIPYYLDES